jgi:uncharacterized protein
MDKAITQTIRIALRSRDEAAALSLLEQHPEQLEAMTPFGTWLHVGSSFGCSKVVKYLLGKGANVDVKAGILGGTAINEAASKGHLEVVTELLQAGASLDTSEPERNPLFSAIFGGHLDVVKLLVSHGVDPLVKYSGENMKGMDAIAFARERGQSEIATFLGQRRGG